MIRQLHINHFQSHDCTTLKFHPGVNVIVGPSDSGKSAIMRALRWVLFNKGGTGAFSHWSPKRMDVGLLLEGKESITRSRSPSGNHYQIEDSELAAVGKDVPPAVSELLNVTDLNMQRQGDPYFLLNDGAPEVARKLNEIAGLESIEQAHTRIAGKIREHQAAERANTTTIAETTEALKKYEGIDEIKGRLTILQQEERAVAFKNDQLDEFQTLIGDIIDAQDVCTQLGTIRYLEEDAQRIERDQCAFESKQERIAALSLLLDGATRAEKDIARFEEVSNEDDVLSIQKQLTQHTQTQQRLETLGALGKNVSMLQAEIDNIRLQETALQNVLDEFGVCPTCGADPENWRNKCL